MKKIIKHAHIKYFFAFALIIAAVAAGTTGVSADNLGCATPPRIAFSSLRSGIFQIYTMNADGTDVVQLTFSLNGADTEPVYSPDNTKIVFNTSRDGDGEIYIMNADGTNQSDLTNSHASTDDFPIFSPDGSKIAFTSDRSGDFDIWVMNADGTNPVNLTNTPGGDLEPKFSPDGSKIVFTSSRDGNTEIYIMKSDGTGQTRLTDVPTIDSQPTFTPDGTKILFSTTRDGNYELYTMGLDGSNPTNFTNNPDHDADARFSQNGSKIAFSSTRDGGDYEIWTMDADGTNPLRLTTSQFSDFDATWSNPCGPAAGPTTTDLAPPAATQYSDMLTLSSTTTANGVPVTSGAVAFYIDGLYVGNDQVDANGVASIEITILLAAGDYTVEANYIASDPDLSDSSDSDTLTITREDATVTPSANNPTSVKVNSPGGNAGPITLCADIGDAPDGNPGDISKAVPVTFVLSPVAPGSTLQAVDSVLDAGTACVTFNSVPVNVYDIVVSIGGDYYNGSGESVLAVYDPSLGFTTGGGSVVNPTTGNTVRFGFNFKYDKKSFKGQMLVMEQAAGGVVKLKSNSLSSLSIVGNQAIVIGKSSIMDGVGNLTFRLNVIDAGEPGSADRFGLKLTTANGTLIPAFTIDPPLTIATGNIQVPQGHR